MKSRDLQQSLSDEKRFYWPIPNDFFIYSNLTPANELYLSTETVWQTYNNASLTLFKKSPRLGNVLDTFWQDSDMSTGLVEVDPCLIPTRVLWKRVPLVAVLVHNSSVVLVGICLSPLRLPCLLAIGKIFVINPRWWSRKLTWPYPQVKLLATDSEFLTLV